MRFTLTSLGKDKKVWGICIENWEGLQELADRHGWQPKGTILPQYDMYGNIYSTEKHDSDSCLFIYDISGRIVSFDDSLAIADALEAALAKNPVEITGDPEDPLSYSSYLDLQGFFTEAGKLYVEEFILFARNGPFYIF